MTHDTAAFLNLPGAGRPGQLVGSATPNGGSPSRPKKPPEATSAAASAEPLAAVTVLGSVAFDRRDVQVLFFGEGAVQYDEAAWGQGWIEFAGAGAQPGCAREVPDERRQDRPM